MSRQWECDCCGHCLTDCECPNRPDDWDQCHDAHAYLCPECGRGFWVHHSEWVSAKGQECSSPLCGGKIRPRSLKFNFQYLYWPPKQRSIREEFENRDEQSRDGVSGD